VSFVLFALILNPLAFDRGALYKLADMGASYGAPSAEVASLEEEGGPRIVATNLLLSDHLRFILDSGIADSLSTELIRPEPASRADLILGLLSEFGILIDGPFQVEDGKWACTVHRLNPESGQAASIRKELERGTYPHDAIPIRGPIASIRVTSQAGPFNEASMSYRVSLMRNAIAPLSNSTPQYLFRRSAFVGLPIRPVKISMEPDDFGLAVIDDLIAIQDVVARLEQTSEQGLDFAHLSETFNRRTKERAARAFAGVMRTLMAEPNADNLANGTEAPISIQSLPHSFASKLGACRLVNGVNHAGLLNFTVFVLVVWGLVSLLVPGGTSPRVAIKRAEDLTGLLPMLGFLGTLYGMLLAFSADDQGGGTELISYIGVSLDTTILAVCGSILLNSALMWRTRRLALAKEEGWAKTQPAKSS